MMIGLKVPTKQFKGIRSSGKTLTFQPGVPALNCAVSWQGSLAN
jgi:hypothetical protein